MSYIQIKPFVFFINKFKNNNIYINILNYYVIIINNLNRIFDNNNFEL